MRHLDSSELGTSDPNRNLSQFVVMSYFCSTFKYCDADNDASALYSVSESLFGREGSSGWQVGRISWCLFDMLIASPPETELAVARYPMVTGRQSRVSGR